jgi:precorrin-6B methylase 2
MNRPLFNLHFKLMSFTYRIRDILRPRKPILEEAEIKPGFHVLDFGSGPGSYVFPVSGLAGPRGKVYALDLIELVIMMIPDNFFR